MSTVRIVHVSNVVVPASAAPPPGPLKLNAMEVQWLVIPLLQHLLFFQGNELPAFDAMVQSLQSSLAATLATHAPLAGKLYHLADTGDVAILCSASDSVKLVVAESDADVGRLAGHEDHDASTFEQLVPELCVTELPASVLAVQATRLGGGGLALGVTMHHAVADGRSLWKFVEAWAAVCRGGAPPTPPVFDRSRVRLPGGDELTQSALRKYAPKLPSTPGIPKEFLQDRMRFTRRTFTVDARQVQRLKERVAHLGESLGAPLRRPLSSFVAVVALSWTCIARSKLASVDDEDAFLFFFADVRNRLDPPAGAEYFGSCLSGCLARVRARELHAESAPAAAASAVQGAIRKMVDNPAAGWELSSLGGEFPDRRTFPLDRMVNVSGSSSFRAYEVADFGWGKPRRTEPVRMNHDGQVALMRASDGDGVQVSVSMLHQAHMDKFKSEFFQLLG